MTILVSLSSSAGGPVVKIDFSLFNVELGDTGAEVIFQ